MTTCNKMNSRCIIQVKLPTEMAVKRKFRMVGGHEGGAIPKLLFMEIPTPRATRMSPSVEIPYRKPSSFAFMDTNIRNYV